PEAVTGPVTADGAEAAAAPAARARPPKNATRRLLPIRSGALPARGKEGAKKAQGFGALCNGPRSRLAAQTDARGKPARPDGRRGRGATGAAAAPTSLHIRPAACASSSPCSRASDCHVPKETACPIAARTRFAAPPRSPRPCIRTPAASATKPWKAEKLVCT